MKTRIIHTISLKVALVLSFTISLASIANAQPLYRMGPSGGLGGTPFYDTNVQPDSRVHQVLVRHGKWIEAVQVIHSAGKAMRHHGGKGGKLSRFTLAEGEYIKAIGGKYGRFVDSIKIYTNKGASPNYGGSGGNVNFYYMAPKEFEIVGFLGRSGALVDSIGIIMRKIK